MTDAESPHYNKMVESCQAAANNQDVEYIMSVGGMFLLGNIRNDLIAQRQVLSEFLGQADGVSDHMAIARAEAISEASCIIIDFLTDAFTACAEVVGPKRSKLVFEAIREFGKD